jgi:hypothetical protein
MRVLPVLALMLACVSSQAADGPELSGVLRAIPQLHELRGTSPLAAGAPLTDLGRDRFRAEVEVSAKWRAVAFTGTARSVALDGREPRHEGLVNELYVDTRIGGEAFTFGKKILGWGVGFAFRPLDVVQQQDRRLLNVFTFEGVPAVAWERFTESAAWTVVYANPASGRTADPREDESLALRYYLQDTSTDWHGVARWSAGTGLQAGLGWNRVLSDAVQLYASGLAMQRYDFARNRLVGAAVPLAPGDPFVSTRRGVTAQLSVGGSWTGESGIGWLVEAWYDGTAYRAEDWADLHRLALAQAALLGVPGVAAGAVSGNLAFGTRAFERQNVIRENVLVRWSYDSESWDASLDVLVTPRDGGSVWTASVSRQYDRLRWEIGARRFAGPSDAAFGLLPERLVAYAATQYFF